MTTPDPTPTVTEDGPVVVPTPAPDDDSPLDLAAARKLRSENKSLRDRLRTTETDLEAAVTRLAAAQHAEVERLAAEHLVDPSDIWRAQPDLAAFTDEEFRSITADRVVETAKALIAEKPHLAKPVTPTAPPTDRPIEGLRSGARPEATPTETTWAQALRG